MTAVSFPDLEAKSPDGRFLFTARSPHNADGSRRAFQRDFRYRLARDGEEVWSAVQEVREPSPRELYLSDSGYTVVRTHGYAKELLICRDPMGRETGRAALGHGDDNSDDAVFRDRHIRVSTAGLTFPGDSLGYFFETDAPYFGLHFPWCRRLLIALQQGVLLTDEASLGQAAAKRESEVSLDIVADGMTQSARNRDGRFGGAMECLLHHRPADALELLSRAEREPSTSEWAGNSHTLDFRLCGPLGKRARIALALRLYGRLPAGLPGTAFFEKFDEPQNRDWPSEVPTRDERWNNLPTDLTARNVIHHLGAPDRIVPFSRKTAQRYEWGDRWSYFRGLGRHTEEVIFSWKPESRGEELESLLVQPVDKVYSPRF